MKRYECAECGSTKLIILGATRAWALRCANDHVVVPYDGFRLELHLESNLPPGVVIPQPRTVRGLLAEAVRLDTERRVPSRG